MQHLVDQRLLREVEDFRLRFACPDCEHYDAVDSTCSNGFPVGPHLEADVSRRSLLVFCKAFELGT